MAAFQTRPADSERTPGAQISPAQDAERDHVGKWPPVIRVNGLQVGNDAINPQQALRTGDATSSVRDAGQAPSHEDEHKTGEPPAVAA